MDKPTELKLLKTEPTGLLSSLLYSIDDKGNVWRCDEANGVRSAWRLYKTANEVPPAPLSVEQILKQARL